MTFAPHMHPVGRPVMVPCRRCVAVLATLVPWLFYFESA
jgi:hypothetical protein